jgi:type I restriction enzyme S subunit
VTRVQDLIDTLAPNGVEVKTLGDIARFVRGNGMPKSDLVNEGVGAIHYGQIYTRYGVWTHETVSFVAPETAAKLAKAQPGDIIITNTSENIEDVGKAVAWLGTEPIVTGGHATVIKHDLDPKYLAYWFQSAAFKTQKRRLATGTKVIDVSARQLAKVRIPVPPIGVQREIARILDDFRELEAELGEALRAELEARLEERRFHRRLILEGHSGGSREVLLGDVVDTLAGFAFESSRFSDNPADVALLRGDNIAQGSLKNRGFKRWRRTPQDGLDDYELRAGDIVVAMDRPWIPAGLKWAQLASADLPALLVQRVARLRAHEQLVDQDFLGCVVSSEAFTAHILRSQTGNTVPHISGRQIAAFRFSLPTRPEQKRIAATLHEYDTRTTDLAAALNIERTARHKQYEYYRDKLLMFEAAGA